MNTYEKLFEFLGVRGDINLVINNKDYHAISFGDKFKSLCRDLSLDESLVQKYILEYALYEVYKEQSYFTNEEINLMDLFGEEIVLKQTLGDILDKKFSNSPASYYESFGYLLNEKEGKYGEDERDKLIQAIENVSQVTSIYFKIEGTFFRIYKEKLKRHHQPFNKSADKINIVKDIDKFKSNTLSYLQQLNSSKNLNYTQDVIELEKSTNMIFTFHLYKLIEENRKSFEKEKEDNYFNTLSSLIIIDNIYLKLYLAKKLITKELIIEEYFPESEFHYLLHNIYKLAVLYPILVKVYIKNSLYNHAKRVGILSIDEDSKKIDNKTDFIQLSDIKSRAYIYEILHENKPFNINNILQSFQPIQVKDRILYKNIYTKISSIQQLKSELEMDFAEGFNQIIDSYCSENELSEIDIQVILEGKLIKLQESVISKWRKDRVKKN